MTPDRDRRSSGGGRGPPRNGGYKVLCVSSLHPKASDDVIRDTLYREYKKFGDISVRVVQDPDERVAYVYFRNFEDAHDAGKKSFEFKVQLLLRRFERLNLHSILRRVYISCRTG